MNATFTEGRSVMKAQFVVLAIALAAIMTGTPRLNAQVTGATFTGKVTDTAGSVVVNAQVELIKDSTATHRMTTTNDSGSYTIPNLVPGTYTVTVTASSFAPMVLKDLNLEVGQNAEQNFTLHAGSVTEQVQVSAVTTDMNLTTSEISNVVNSTTVRQLPLN